MGDIKAIFTGAQIVKDLSIFENKSRSDIIRAFQIIGEDAVNDAKSRPQSETYIDRTTNLRNSIGYGVKSNDNLVSVDANRLLSKQLIDGLKSNVDIELNIVAGMDYALWVESMEGHSVLSGSIPTKEQIEKTLKEILG